MKYHGGSIMKRCS